MDCMSSRKVLAEEAHHDLIEDLFIGLDEETRKSVTLRDFAYVIRTIVEPDIK